MASTSSLTFADLLRYHRTATGLTQEELAARASLSVDAISTLERGTRRRPRKDTVALLADALALPEEERAAFAAAARRSSAASLAATPPGEAVSTLEGHAPALSAVSDATLPHGVVTFLFADIEDSTRLLHELGDRYAEVLAEVQVLLGPIWAAHAGHELGTQGDRFFAVFAYPDDALAAAAAAQQALAAHSWPAPWPDAARVRIRIRMGLHTGATLLTAGRYIGLEVHRAARIAATGHGGQVVVSGALAEQVATFGYELPAGTRLRSLGKHRLQDVPHREELSQLVLPDLPGLPATYPPLRTLDAWPGLRADLTAMALMSAMLLVVVGLLLPLVVPVFPWAIGLVMAGLTVLLLVAAVLAQPLRQALMSQWREARKPVAAVTSVLLSLAVVATTLFLTKPPILVGPKPLGYDFSYISHAPTHRGGTVTVGLWFPLQTLRPIYSPFPSEGYYGLWQSCLAQLPDVRLGFASYRPDQCTEVPSVANGGESVDGKTTIFHIDPRAVWSDGAPILAADYLFAQRLLADPNLNGGPPYTLMTLTAPDPHMVVVHWDVQYGDYLTALANLPPIPLHIYATGSFAGVYVPATGTYNSALAHRLVDSDLFNTSIPVDSGPFLVQHFIPDDRAVLVRNPLFFSNFFHRPVLDQVTFVTANRSVAQGEDPTKAEMKGALIANYRKGTMDVVEALSPLDLSRLGGIPKAQVVTSPTANWIEIGFNRRPQAPNAQANGGVSIFADPNVRKAFVEAFDRCAAVRAQLGISNCADPNFFTDELTAPSAPDYDPSVKLPSYNPTDAARLMDRAGYPVVDGVRRAKDGRTPLRLSIDMSFSAIENQLVGQRMQKDFARNLKIAVTLAPVPNLTIPGSTSPWTQGTFDIGLVGDGVFPDPVGAVLGLLGGADAADIPSAQHPTGGNWLGVIDPLIAQQDALGAETIDGAQRADVYRELQRHVARQLYMEPVYLIASVTLTRPTLCNFKKWAQGASTWNMADWYVAPTCP
jgi:ABC-type transport system substrate-binding protein/class 3 adenylate cyclase/DNA-binding XRE family transcriptional regulator